MSSELETVLQEEPLVEPPKDNTQAPETLEPIILEPVPSGDVVPVGDEKKLTVLRTIPVTYKRKSKGKISCRDIGSMDLCTESADPKQIRIDFNALVNLTLGYMMKQKLGLNHANWSLRLVFDEQGPSRIMVET